MFTTKIPHSIRLCIAQPRTGALAVDALWLPALRWFIWTVSAITVLLANTTSLNAQLCNHTWSTGFHLPGPNEAVYATLLRSDSFGTTLYAGGLFTHANGVVVNRVAQWNGGSWAALGSGMNGAVRTLAIFNGDLVAGGAFTTAGGVAVNYVARWTGANWAPLGTGFNAFVYSLCVFNGELIAGGSFTTAGGTPANHIARWDGNQWLPLSTGIIGTDFFLFPTTVRCLSIFQNNLIAGGNFTTAGGVPALNIANWNGIAWTPLAAGVGQNDSSHAVHALTVFEGELIAGGKFNLTGSSTINSVARWNGSAWSDVGASRFILGTLTTDMSPSVFSLASHGGYLEAGGDFQGMSQGPAAHALAKWSAASGWANESSGVDGVVYCLSDAGSDLYVGGRFGTRGTTVATNLTQLAALGSWNILGTGSGILGSIRAMSSRLGNLFIGGQLGSVAGLAGGGLVAWTNNGYEYFPDLAAPAVVNAIMPDYQGEIVVQASGNGIACPVQRWNSINHWRCLTCWGPSAEEFLLFGGNLFNNMKMWNGIMCTTLGSSDGTIKAQCAYGDLVVFGGTFSNIGNIAALRVAAWNGMTQTWLPFGSGVDGYFATTEVRALASFGADLVAAGSFTLAGGNAASNIARWDGIDWRPLGSGTNGAINALTVFDGALIAGGEFTTAGGISVNRIARWDGTVWSPLGDGLTKLTTAPKVTAFAVVDPDGPGPLSASLYVGGSFDFAGGIASSCVARWGDPVIGIGDLNSDDVLDANDIAAFSLALVDPIGFAVVFPTSSLARADLTCDGNVDGLDVQPFVGLLLGS